MNFNRFIWPKELNFIYLTEFHLFLYTYVTSVSDLSSDLKKNHSNQNARLFQPISHNKILDLSNFKEFADNVIVTQETDLL